MSTVTNYWTEPRASVLLCQDLCKLVMSVLSTKYQKLGKLRSRLIVTTLQKACALVRVFDDRILTEHVTYRSTFLVVFTCHLVIESKKMYLNIINKRLYICCKNLLTPLS